MVVEERRSSLFRNGQVYKGEFTRDSEWILKVQPFIDRQWLRCGYLAPVDVLMDVGALDKRKYEDWKNGRLQLLMHIQVNMS